jgi:hypothetical protein
MKRKFSKNSFLILSIISIILALANNKFLDPQISKIFLIIFLINSLIKSASNDIKNNLLVSEKIKSIILSIFWHSIIIFIIIVLIPTTLCKIFLITIFVILSIILLIIQIYVQTAIYIGGWWIIKYKNKYYALVEDHNLKENIIVEILESEAKEILSNYENGWKQAQSMWGWEDLDIYLGKNKD